MKTITRKDRFALEQLVMENFEIVLGEPEGIEVDQEMQMQMQPDQYEHEKEEEHISTIELSKLHEYSGGLLQSCAPEQLDPWMIADIARASELVAKIYYRVCGADYANMGQGE